MKNKKMTSVIVLFVALFLGLVSVVYAAGNIDSTNKWAWGGNVGWLNFNPTHGGGVTVYDDHLEGYAWAENIGWINLSPAVHGGVFNDGSGNLSGHAWSANAGWINFNPSHGQVTIDSTTGEFDGYAWGENVGWIHFKNTGDNAYGVVIGSSSKIYLPIIIKN